MKSALIRLSLVENVNNFVNIVARYPYEMDLRAGRHVVDANTLEIYSDDCSDLLEEIKPFLAAEE